MNKASFLFLLLIGAIALIGAYNALFPVPASTAFIRFFGLSAFLLLCVSLIIGPLTVLWPSSFGQIVEPRRAVGIASFAFVLLHIALLAASRFGWDALSVLGAANPLITIPATGILLALTLTSSDWAVRTMGPVLWKNVQRFNYFAFILSFVHFVLFSNGLFAAAKGRIFVNIAEVALVLLGIATVALQVTGFVVRKRKEGQLKAAATGSRPAPASTSPPS